MVARPDPVAQRSFIPSILKLMKFCWKVLRYGLEFLSKVFCSFNMIFLCTIKFCICTQNAFIKKKYCKCNSFGRFGHFPFVWQSFVALKNDLNSATAVNKNCLQAWRIYFCLLKSFLGLKRQTQKCFFSDTVHWGLQIQN